MKKKHIVILSIGSLLILAYLVLTGFDPKYKERNMIFMPPHDDYADQWEEVKEKEKDGLYKSALEIVNDIYEEAKSDKNYTQLIKTLIHKLKHSSYLKDDDLVYSITSIEDEFKDIESPQKELLHSVIGQLYWQYYNQNRWKILDRTNTSQYDDKDIQTWSAEQLMQKIDEHYSQSIANRHITEKTRIKDFEVLLNEEENTLNLRPTLYDFLAHRALNFYQNTELELTKPSYAFELNDKKWFSNTSTFVGIKAETKDKNSYKLKALNIFKNLEQNHQAKNHQAYFEAIVNRLDFVKNHSILPQNENQELYINSLTELHSAYQKNKPAIVAYNIARYYHQQGEKYNTNNTKYQNELKTAISWCEKAISYDDSYWSPLAKNLKAQIQAAILDFETVNAALPSENIKILFQYKNLNKVKVDIYRVDYITYMFKQFEDNEERLKWIRQQELHSNTSFELPTYDDHQLHSFEAKLDKLPKGHYHIVVSNADNVKEIVQNNIIWSTNLSFIQQDNQYMILDRENGTPIPDVKVQLFEREYDYNSRTYKLNKREVLTSDKNGIVKVKRTKNYRNFFLDLQKGNDRYSGGQNHYLYNRHDYKYEKRTYHHLFTDRAIYRPGQTIYFKGIAIENSSENERKLLKNKQFEAIFYDANYQKVSSLKLTSNKYGTYQGSFTAPKGLLNGYMTIRVGSSSKGFRVEEYKRPKFEVKTEPIKGEFKLNETITIDGIAKAYAGNNIDGAKVSFNVMRTARFPWWCYYHWGYNPISPAMQITQGTTTTNEKGEYKITFEATPDHTVEKKFEPTFTYEVKIDVTDINGETQSTTQYINVGYNALQISTDIPETLDLAAPEKAFNIITKNLNGEDVKAEGKIEIYKIKNEGLKRSRLFTKVEKMQLDKSQYESAFPLDVYPLEDKDANKELIKTISFNTSNSKNLAFNKSEFKIGDYEMVLHSKDKFGNNVKNIQQLVIFDCNSNKMPFESYFWAHPIKTKYEIGETAQLMLGSSLKNAKVYFEIEHQHKIIHSEWLEIKDALTKIKIPVEEKYRGNFAVHLNMVADNRSYQHTQLFEVPFSNKKLNLTFETFRNKLLPGQEEEWKLKITGPNGDKVAAELLATLYDASLDAFSANSFLLDIYNSYYTSQSWNNRIIHKNQGQTLLSYVLPRFTVPNHRYYELNWFGYNMYHSYRYRGSRSYKDAYAMTDEMMESKEMVVEGKAMAVPMLDADANNNELEQKRNEGKNHATEPSPDEGDDKEFASAKIRKNFNETAFFLPQLETDENGSIIIKFTIPEALTRWKFLGLAHTEDLKIGTIQKETVTQKDLMVFPNLPRFLREKDEIQLSTKIANLTESSISGKVNIEFLDAYSMKNINDKFNLSDISQNFTVDANLSTQKSWIVKIPEGVDAVICRIVAQSSKHSDGEENPLPILTNRMLVTESMPIHARTKGTHSFFFDKLKNQNSTTLSHHKLTLEYVSNPIWYVVQAMPYMMEYPYECAEQTFTRYYANSMATYIMNSNPRIKQTIEQWKDLSPDDFLSNLEKNQELKSLLLEETPWVLDAQNETERKKRISLLFDLNRMTSEMSRAKRKFIKMQTSNGGFAWFPGMPDNRYITQYIATGIGRMNNLGIIDLNKDSELNASYKRAMNYLDQRIVEDYEWIKKHNPKYQEEKHISYNHIQYLYARSYTKMSFSVKKDAFEYFTNQAKKYWKDHNNYAQGMIALALKRSEGKNTISDKIVNSLDEQAIRHKELGAYWKGMMDGGYYWYQAPIETQALMIELFDEVANNETMVNDLKTWLLKQKQTTDWKTTKATAEACYAMLLRGEEWISVTSNDKIIVGKIEVKTESKASNPVGQIKKSWAKSEIKTDMASVIIQKENNSVSWGALYWQYFEDLDKITPHKTPLHIEKGLFISNNTDEGKTITPIDKKDIKVGDKVVVRITIRVDRNMEFVHLKDMRASGFEPINVLSTYKWQGGLGYYESTKDASTNFFMDYLPRGTYVFEYPLRASQAGNFSNGITSMQCMYAPEFTTHSQGIRVKVK